jgi:hypothetical protein
LRGEDSELIGALNVDKLRLLEQLALVADDVVAIDRGKTAEIGADAAINVRG